MRKGVEGYSFSFLISILIIAILLPVFFELYYDFKNVQDLKSFSTGLKSIRKEVNLLKSTGKGSFSRVYLTVPRYYSLKLVNSSVIVNTLSEKNSFDVNAGFKKEYVFSTGEYDIVLCYSSCSSDFSNLIVFN